MFPLIFYALAVIILAPLAGRYFFRKRLTRDITTVLSTTMSTVGPKQLAARLGSLPEPARRYLGFAIREGAPPTRTVRMEHGGTFRTKPDQDWMAISGLQYFTAATPGFVWSGRVRPGPLLWIEARDRLYKGRGSMLVKLEWLYTIANAAGPEIDQGASLRWLAEAIWFPYAFVGDAVRWEAVGQDSARATLTQERAQVTSIFEFDDAGRIAVIRAERYRDAGGKAILTPWIGRCSAYREFGPFQAPAHVEVAWILDGVEFVYARFDVTSIVYNAAD